MTSCIYSVLLHFQELHFQRIICIRQKCFVGLVDKGLYLDFSRGINKFLSENNNERLLIVKTPK